jgi:hypothetical protein
MALGAVLAAALTDHSARAKGLYVGGQDVLLEPGTGGNRMGTPIESVTVTEAGWNGVSSMTFRIEDPALEVSLSDGIEVRFHNITLDYPIFLGFIQTFDTISDFGNQGRTFVVTAVGIEIVLDWAKTTATLTFAAGSDLGGTVQSICANVEGVGPLRAFDNNSSFGSQAFPLAASNIGPMAAFTIPAGTTLREAIRLAQVAYYAGSGADPSVQWPFTVDFFYGLRMFQRNAIVPEFPSDYAEELVVDTAASATNGEDVRYSWDGAGAVRSVLVIGTGVSALVSADTGLPGQVAVISDTTITTLAAAQGAGQSYLSTMLATIRGSYRQSDRVASTTVHAIGRVRITDASMGLSAKPFAIFQIQKTFNPSGRENWTVSFGGLPPSGAALMRRLTRATLS